jgi:hypothetical protein
MNVQSSRKKTMAEYIARGRPEWAYSIDERKVEAYRRNFLFEKCIQLPGAGLPSQVHLSSVC